MYVQCIVHMCRDSLTWSDPFRQVFRAGRYRLEMISGRAKFCAAWLSSSLIDNAPLAKRSGHARLVPGSLTDFLFTMNENS